MSGGKERRGVPPIVTLGTQRDWALEEENNRATRDLYLARLPGIKLSQKRIFT